MKTWNIRFYEHRKIYFAISLLLAAAMLLGLLVRGVSLDIQFKGGALLTYSYQGEVDAKALPLPHRKCSARTFPCRRLRILRPADKTL